MAGYDRLDRIARAARSAGDPRTLAQLRADVFTAVLAGNPFHTMPPTDPLTQQADAEHPAQADPDNDNGKDSGRTRKGPVPGPQTGIRPSVQVPVLETGIRPWSSMSGSPSGWPPSATPNRPTSIPGSQPGVVKLPRTVNGPGPATLPSPNPGLKRESQARRPAPQPAGNRCACGGIQPKFRRGVVDIQVKLSTLAELDNDPALIPGWGPVIADIARQVAHDQQVNPRWKWSATDENGELLHHGHTGRRPNATEDAFVRARDRSCRAPGCRAPDSALRDRSPGRTRPRRTVAPRAISTLAANTTTVSAAKTATASPAPKTASDGPHPTAAATTSATTRTSS